MILSDKGFLLSKNKYNENSVIANFYTENHGRISGIIFGSNSKKIKNYLFIGNKFHINYHLKNNSKIGYFKIEIDTLNTPLHLDDQVKLSCIVYVMKIIKILTAENQENKLIYDELNNFFLSLKNDYWLKNFIHWELKMLKIIGYDISFKDYVTNDVVDGKNKYIVKTSNGNKIIPNFLIEKNNDTVVLEDLLLSLRIVGDFINKTILKPNNISYPISRTDFLNLIK
tara:strand:+ start:1464 stop:2144 length:681 start_codon:yes stop_codon:yes gene_type:complete